MILFKLEPKYIRTKDGRIIDLTAYRKGEEINGGIKFIHKINGNFFFIQNDNILKQANTIEELCDKWVFDTNDEKYVIRDTKYYTLLIMQNSLKDKKKSNIRLAIWTDEGLIFKAKMNEKGELKLC